MRLLSLLFVSLMHLGAAAQFVTEEKVLSTATGNLKGTLIIPENGKATFTVNIFQAGSGPTDRNGNSPLGVKANSYRLIAEALAAKNIATLLVDKRCIAASAAACKGEINLRFDDYADDLAAWIQMLKKDKRFKKIFIIGHSEGSLVGMLAAQKEKVNGYISIAGAGQSIDKVIVKQYNAQSPQTALVVDSMFTRLYKGQKLDSVPRALINLLRPSIQPYMKSWISHDPCEEIKKLSIPVMIIQGSTDLQTDAAEGMLLKKCAPKATYVFIEGMNHVLKDAPADRVQNSATYNNAALPLSAGLTDAIIRFEKK